MDVPSSIENIPFVWGIAFTINVLMGASCFTMIIRREAPQWASGICCWIGWWSCASAFSLVINTAVGIENPFSYHQMGVLTESMTNIGITLWCVIFLLKNWNVHGDKDLAEIEKVRSEVSIRNLQNEVENGAK